MNNLYKTTLQLIRDSGMPLSRIAREADVGHRWLVDVMNGRFSDPGVNKIQRLHDYLIERNQTLSGQDKVAA